MGAQKIETPQNSAMIMGEGDLESVWSPESYMRLDSMNKLTHLWCIRSHHDLKPIVIVFERIGLESTCKD